MVLLLPVVGLSQETLTLTLEESVSMALKQNPEILIAEKEAVKSGAEVWEAWAGLLPTLDASANLSHAWDIQTTTIPNFLKPMLAPLAPAVPELADMPDFVQLAFGLENTLTYGLTLNQPLFLGGAGIAGVKMARATHRASLHRLESTRQNLIYQTVTAFYGCLLAREVVQVQREAFSQAEANLDVVLKKYDAGSASGFDKMRAEVEAANLKPEVIAANNEYQSALTGFRMILGLPKETGIEVEGALFYEPDDFVGLSLEDIQAQAFENRPELLELVSQRAIAANGVTLARSEFMPKLFFSTDYSFLAMRNDFDFGEDDFSKGFTSAVSLQIPLFRGFANWKKCQKAKLDYKIILDSEKLTKDGIVAEVEIAYNNFREAMERYQAADESVDLAEKTLRLANLMYEEGASTQLDVLGSQLALTEARLNYATALFDYQVTRYELRLVAGVLEGVL
jgi:outer membrane protein TolC